MKGAHEQSHESYHLPNKCSGVIKLAGAMVALALLGWPSAALPASDVSDHEKSAALWPGPDSITTRYLVADPPIPYKGEGGSKLSVQGIDFWSFGRPSQLNKKLGTVVAEFAPLKPGEASGLTAVEFFSAVQEKVAKIAESVGASAAIPVGAKQDQDGTSHLFYRIVLYLPENAPIDGPVRNDPTPVDADGNRIPNGLERPMTTLATADFSNTEWPLLQGTALINVCVGVDGKVTDASIVTSSGHRELDGLGLNAARKGKFAPATVRGRPVASCNEYKFSWKHN